MQLTQFQMFTYKQRRKVIDKFQKKYKTSEDKEQILKQMENQDIDFLIYCSDNIYAKMFYSKFKKKR